MIESVAVTDKKANDTPDLMTLIRQAICYQGLTPVEKITSLMLLRDEALVEMQATAERVLTDD
jgi:hypothetical protein